MKSQLESIDDINAIMNNVSININNNINVYQWRNGANKINSIEIINNVNINQWRNVEYQ
jgi:hypothetical protein